MKQIFQRQKRGNVNDLPEADVAHGKIGTSAHALKALLKHHARCWDFHFHIYGL